MKKAYDLQTGGVDENDPMGRNPLRLMLVDDHSMVRMGFVTLLGTERDFEIVAEAEDAAQALEMYRIHRPDVTLMDAKMPGESGIDALRKIRREFPGARVIILTTYDFEEPVFAAMEAGAAGYVLKSVKRDELVALVRRVHSGGRRFPAGMAERFARRQPREKLSPRELETLDLVRRGFSNKDIGSALGVSENTVKAHVKSILQKLGVGDRAEAVAAGFERGLFKDV
ncbi:MAG: response regulator transcription factor [Verrucomicrobiota bacterium]